MTADRRPSTADWGCRLQTAAFAVLLAVVAARPFLNEMQFRSPALNVSAIRSGDTPDLAAAQGVDRWELSRVTFAVLILLAGALWLTGAAMSGAGRIRHAWLGVLLLAFAGVGLASALDAPDRRSGLDVWIEQVSLLLAAMLFAQLCADHRRWTLLMIVLAATGGALAIKGLWQVMVEFPERVLEFQEGPADMLRRIGWAPGTPGAVLFESRLRDRSVTCFFGLPNPLASMMLVMLGAGAGLAGDKLTAALKALKTDRAKLRKGEVHLPTLAGGASALLAALIAVVLVLTRSRGGMLSAGTAFAAGVVIFRYRDRLAAHWRRMVLVAAGVFLVGAGAVVTYGLATDRLPTTTMTFRWYYWSATGEIIRDHPLLGVGPGNFPGAYLRYRRPQAEEAVKAPHNVILHALVQFGVPGGLVYLGILGGVLVLIARPPKHGADSADCGPEPASTVDSIPTGHGRLSDQGSPPDAQGARGLRVLVPVALAPLIARVAFANTGMDPSILFLDGIMPAGALAACLVVTAWGSRGGLSGRGVPGPVGRVALGCALAGFALHSMIELSPWMPAPALVFWSAAGAMLAQSGPGRSRNLSTGRRVWPVLAWAGVAAAVVLLWWPVARKVALSTEAARQVATADIDAACRLAEAAAEADPLDSHAAAEASRLHLTACPRGIDAKRQADAVSRRLDLAARWAGEAVRRDPADFSNYRLAGQVLWLQADPGAIKYAASIPDGNRADIRDRLLADLKNDPNNEVLMLLLARIAAAQGDRAEAVRRCEQALRQDPNCPLLLGELGDAAWRAGMEPKAVAAWRRAWGLAPRGLTADRAVELYAKAVELNPQDMRLRLSFAQMLCRAGRTTESLAQLEAVKGIDRLLLPASVERLTLAEDEAVTLLNTRLTVLVPVKTPGKLTSDRDQQPVEEARPP